MARTKWPSVPQLKVNEMKINEGVATSLRGNLSNLVREEKYNGQDYLVAPVVLITEGVTKGVLYPAEELKKFPASWNGSPLPINHPKVNGKPVSANNLRILKENNVGQLFDVKFEEANDTHKARLTGEAWINKTLAETQSPRLLELLENESNIDVSTGLWTDDENTPGKFNGKDYTAIARNHRPDHLALLPDGVGACSWDDGAGLVRNSSEKLPIKERLKAIFTEAKEEALDELAANELSHSDIRAGLRSALEGSIRLAPEQFLWIEEVFDRFFIYSFDDGNGTKLFRSDYSVGSDDALTVDSERTEVTRTVEFVPTPTVNSAPSTKQKPEGKPKMKELVDGLIANSATQYAEDDREWMMKLNEAQLNRMLPATVEGGDEPTGNQAAPSTPAAPATEGKSVQEQIAEQFKIHAEAQAVATAKVLQVELAKIKTNDAKVVSIAALKAHGCDLSEDGLKALTVEDLQKLEVKHGVMRLDYSGTGGMHSNAAAASDDVPAMPLIIPLKKEA